MIVETFQCFYIIVMYCHHLSCVNDVAHIRVLFNCGIFSLGSLSESVLN